VEIHSSAHKHGIDEDNIRHALDHAIVVADLEPDADPPRVRSSARTQPGTSLRSFGWSRLTSVGS